jgi:hypothetical protein
MDLDHQAAIISNITKFKLARYRLTIEALEPLDLPPFKGSALRGGFGHIFKRLTCFQSKLCDKKCRLGNECPYGYIFETAPPDNSEVLRTFHEIPRPFIIEPPMDQRARFAPGEKLEFGLTLIGRGNNYLSYFVIVFRGLGQAGLGRTRGKFRLLAIDAMLPNGAGVEPVYRAADESIRTVEATMSIESIIVHAAALPPNQITLNFLTPTRLKQEKKWVWEGPPFEVLVRSLLSRTSSLSYFHCGQRLEVDFRGLIDRAAEVQIGRNDTHWEDWERFSGRQKQSVKMGGLMGKVTYQGDLAPYLPLLALGELIHVGKGTVFGNGQYQIMGVET